MCCNLVKSNKNIDGMSWRCINKLCTKYKVYFSIRKNSFFDKFSTSLRIIFKILLKYACKQQVYTIVESLDINAKTVEKIIIHLISFIPKPDFSNDKLGGPGVIVQVDETMFNYKCKSHRGRSPANRTDALCIVEVNRIITRAFACVIPNKKSTTLVPIITNNVASNSTVWTDEHRSYAKLCDFFKSTGSFCHKYRFINDDGVNTQAVESFNNLLKYEIKKKRN